MSWLLNAIYMAILLVASPWLLYRAVTTGRYREGWLQKILGRVPSSVDVQLRSRMACGPVVWLHGVSVGEVQLLKPLLAQLRTEDPRVQLVVSTTTHAGMELAKKIFPGELLFYFPMDFSWAVNRVLATVEPAALVLGELELWPNLIEAAAKRQVAIVVINARLSAGSFRGYQRFRWLTRAMFGKLRLVAAQDATYATRFVACGTPSARVLITGSTKFDNVTFDRDCPEVEELRRLVGLDDSHRVWIVGSTQAPEERVAASAFLQLSDVHTNVRLIVVPRHPERFDGVFRELRELGLHPLRRSSLPPSLSASEWRVLLVDTVGELRWWWGLAEIALVGGSFGSRGGQNMIEPAAYGANVAFGPNTANFRDISEMLLQSQGASRIDCLEGILPWLREQLEQPELGRQRGRRAQQLVRQHQGALARTIGELRMILHHTKPS